MKLRHFVAALALAVVSTAGVAQTTDLSSPQRQARIDAALDNYHRHPGHRADRMADDRMPARPMTKSSGSVGNDVRQYGRSLVEDAKKAPGVIAKTARDSGHAVADTAREVGRDAKAAAKGAKETVTKE